MIIAALFFLAGLANTASAAYYADVAFVVDQSGSMGQEFTWIGNSLGTIGTEMNNAGITSNFGLAGYEYYAGFANSSNAWQDLTPDINAVTTEINSAALYGGAERAYDAVQWSANNFSWTGGDYQKVMILVTDEYPYAYNSFSYDGLTGETAIAKLVSDEDILLNVITFQGLFQYYDTGVAYEKDGFVGLWDLNYLRTNPADFTDAFIQGKIREIIHATPEPSSMLFVGSCLLGLAALRKKILR